MNGFFDGDFRRKPNVSIGGANRKLNKEELLAKAQKERDEREVGLKKKSFMMPFSEFRMRNDAFFISFFRSYDRKTQVP